MYKLLVLISGNGSNLQYIIYNIKNKTLDSCEIVSVSSNKKNAYGLVRAQ